MSSDPSGAEQEDPLPPTVHVDQELPFLVTHWLTSLSSSNEEENGEKKEALERIRSAASELASAFSTLGAFGAASRPCLSSDPFDLLDAAPVPHPATFADARRRWATSCPPNQLESLVRAAALGSAVVDSSMPDPLRLLHASREIIVHQKQNPDSGRSLQEAIVLDTSTEQKEEEGPVASTLQRPIVVRVHKREGSSNLAKKNANQVLDASGKHSLILVSDIAVKSTEAAKRMRHFLEARDNFRKNDQQIRSLKKSLAFHRDALEALNQQRGRVLQQSMGVDTRIKLLDEIKESEENSNRVIQQLERQLSGLEPAHANDSQALATASSCARQAFAILQGSITGFRNPAKRVLEPGKLNNTVLFNLAARHVGLGRIGQTLVPCSMGRMRPLVAVRETRVAIIKARMSHAVTINTHLQYPVFCLRFDRTGRYFVTGADDYLVRVFCLGANIRSPRDKAIDPSMLYRGAVLVCTLRGHAGVINDIDVSSDNGFLATASEDGDCRVWGLKDGCPVAILRGHDGGCNMVSWSTLTPYRLVTAGADGFARSWDVREACLKRYRKYVGQRPEYRLDVEVSSDHTEPPDAHVTAAEESVPPPLPPLPSRLEGQASDAMNPNLDVGILPPPLPPLPPGENEAPVPHVPAEQANDDDEPGQFVANDSIDDGVKLLDKLRHGASIEEQLTGPGTRSRRAPVRVICVARCPHGGHFATGSDDGICRIWKDDEDKIVQDVDRKSSHFDAGTTDARDFHRSLRSTAPSANRQLLVLKGHISAITDLQYSFRGDRLLSASQKDGVLRIWSWNVDPISSRTEKISHAHIVIKLANPTASVARTNPDGPRRRPIRTSASVSCDVASWVCDDTKIVTSQCELIKQSSTEIAPGSQYLFIWDSHTGDCLLGIHGAHSMQCPVLSPHPRDPSIFCSSGSDGLLKLWDCDTGSCFFTYKNTVDFGPVESHERGKPSGFLDGAFSPDGLSLVLTDDCGRVSVFDCAVPHSTPSVSGVSATPAWMKEQYFSNDYYDLIYDSHGYCVERGSEQPPHLAPRGVRCSHGGVSWSSAVNDGFRHLKGPLPIEEQEARWHRQLISSRLQSASVCQYSLRGNIVSQYDPQTTILLQGDGQSMLLSAEADDRPSEPQAHTPPRNVHRLSSNWRWGDAFNDLPEDANDGDEPDSDDEEYVAGTERRSAISSGLQDSEDDDELDDEEMGLNSPDSRRRSSRQIFDEGDESEMDDLEEFMSTNNEPTGPFVGDYERHYFRLARDAPFLSRAWLRRVESYSSYTGRKIYVPQLGDTVVYVPRAHQEMISAYPSLCAPWQSWPEEAVWPIVRCCIRHIRYRFPYKSYFRGHAGARCRSIVAILTLEVTGVPEASLDHDQRIGLVKPTFYSPPKPHTFELSVFENDEPDYLIPVGLFTSRIEMIDNALQQLDEIPNPPIEALYRANDSEIEDDEFKPWQGHIERFVYDEANDPNLQGSGFDSIEVSWGRREKDRVSAWEISLAASVTPDTNRPCLKEEEKQLVRSALAEIMELRNTDEDEGENRVEDIFKLPVDERRYSDYLTRVEVPMDLNFVSTRIAGDYYATKLSVVSDIRLIRDNCAKYNGDHDSLTLLANEMVERFEALVLSEDERSTLKEFESIAAANATPVHGQTSTERAQTEARSTRPRRAVRSRSAFEDLPAPSAPSAGVSRTRRQVPARPQRARIQGQRLGGRQVSSVLERGQTGQRRSTRRHNAPTLQGTAAVGNQGSSLLQSGQGRGRNGVSSGVGRALRRSSRPNYQEAASDNEESEQPRSRIRITLRSAAEVPQQQNVGARSDRLARRQSRQDEHAMSSDADTAPTRRSTRNSAALRSDDEDSEAEPQDRPRRASPRRGGVENQSPSNARTRRTRARSTRANDSVDEESDQSEDASPASSNVAVMRSRRRKREKSESEESEEEKVSEDEDVDDDEEVDSDSLDSEEETRNTKPTRSRATQNRAPRESTNITRGVDSRRRPAKKSYAEPSSSEFDDSDLNDSEDAQPGSKRRRKGGPAPKSKRKPSKRVKIEVSSPRQPSQKSWGFVDKRDIGPLGESILKKLEEDDPNGTFAEPVEEAYPEVAKEYRKAVKKPMDFRTIREERLPWYGSAEELRDDLLLVFNNCITFNGESSEFSSLAISMIDELDEVFKSACEENGVKVPRRW